jgi:hypothetical protein
MSKNSLTTYVFFRYILNESFLTQDSCECSVSTGVFLKRIVQAIHFKKPVESLIHVKQLFGKKGVFFLPIVQAICFKKPVKSLNSCQTIVWQKRIIFPYYVQALNRQFFKN